MGYLVATGVVLVVALLCSPCSISQCRSAAPRRDAGTPGRCIGSLRATTSSTECSDTTSATNVVPLVRERATAVRQAYPDATVDVTAPDDAFVVEDRGSEVRVSIADSGPQIPKEEIDVFGDGETQLRHSSGVGLWLVTWIVESYGGEVSFERSAEGNVVTLVFPGAGRLDRLVRTRSVSGDI
jgi:signal transduction histidine kinase